MDTLSDDQKIVLARSRLWTPALDKLLRRWKRQISKRQQGHARQGRKYGRRHYIIGIPATLLEAVVTVGVLSTFRNCNDCDDLKSVRCKSDQWIRLSIGLLGIIAVSLSALQTFMNYQESSEKHKNAASEFENLYRVIETLLQVPGSVRGDPISTLHSLRDQYTTLVRSSPQLPKEYSVDLTYTFSGGPKPPRPGQIHVEEPSAKVSPLRKLLKDKGTRIRKRAESSDSDIEIGFDLDAVQSYSGKKAAIAAARLTAAREEQIQRSLSRALEFELERLDDHNPVKIKLNDISYESEEPTSSKSKDEGTSHREDSGNTEKSEPRSESEEIYSANEDDSG